MPAPRASSARSSPPSAPMPPAGGPRSRPPAPARHGACSPISGHDRPALGRPRAASPSARPILLGLRIPPERRLAAVVLAAAAGLAALAAFALAVPLAVLGLGLWRRAGPIPTPGGRSEVETAGLRMTLDHGTGAMDGEVTGGRFDGGWLSELSRAELQDLVAEFEAVGRRRQPGAASRLARPSGRSARGRRGRPRGAGTDRPAGDDRGRGLPRFSGSIPARASRRSARPTVG